MPIRPEMKARYPKDWDEISVGIKTRADWRCECAGQCGRKQHPFDLDGRCPAHHGDTIIGNPNESKVVLTTAHLDHTPENCEPENLRAMCQACHLSYDKDQHRATRVAADYEGMEPLFGATP